MSYLTKILLSTALLISFLPVFGGTVDLAKYKSVKTTEELPYIPNLDFQLKTKGWNVGKGFSWEEGIGINGTGGLRVAIDDPGIRSRTTRNLPLQAGNTYQLTFYVKVIKPVVSNKGKERKDLRPGYIEFTKGGGKKNYLGWLAPGVVKNDPEQDWQLSKTTFTVPSNATTTRLTLWMHNWNNIGEVIFDQINIRPEASNATAYITYPAYNTIPDSGGHLKIRVFTDSKEQEALIEANDAVININIAGNITQYSGKVKDGFIELKTDKLPKGDGSLEIAIVNHAKKTRIDTFSIPVSVKTQMTPPQNAVTFDEFNRAWINGELFMPLGVYVITGNLPKTVKWDFTTEMKIIGKSPFNTVLDYHSHVWHRQGQNKNADICHENGLKFILNISSYGEPESNGKYDANAKELVQKYKTHPALLSWYLSDELPMSKLDQIVARRKWVNSMDPDHPTFLVHHIPLDSPYYGTGADVIGCDPYPLRKKDVPRDLSKVLEDSKRIQSSGKVIWNAPQIYSQGTHQDRGKNYNLYIEPSTEEMISMYLLMANYGARGFISYARSRLYSHPEALKNYEQKWKDVCAAAQVVLDQKDYIMSKKGPLPANTKSISGKVNAKEYISDTGDKRVFIVGYISGKNSAEIIIENPTALKSKFGLTKHIEGNKYLFDSDGINSDILY